MGWKASGEPAVRRQRSKWVVRVDGIDTETGRRRPRQLGTFPSRRAAEVAAREAVAQERTIERGTVGWLVRRSVASRLDVSAKTREQYEWAASHIAAGLGGIPLDRLEREDVGLWLAGLADSGRFSRRSIQIFRNLLRAALADAVDEGLLRRSPAARVALPRAIAKPPRVREAAAWTAPDVARFLEVTSGHRLAAAFRISVLYGLRRSEVLALRWDDADLAGAALRIDEGLVPLNSGAVEWTPAKNARSRRTIALDPDTVRALALRRRAQAEERLLAGPAWSDQDLVFTTRLGEAVLPRSYDRTLALLVAEAGVPRLSSHGLRHTAATHMVTSSMDLGELRAVADVLGHSPEMLLRIYAHALPEQIRAIAVRIGERHGVSRHH
jgi:integrase